MRDLGIVVLSCDRYNSLWDLFFSRWERYWPDCPYSIYLICNHMKYDRPGVQAIRIGDDLDWSSNLLSVLDKISHENLLLMMEDAPLDKLVDGGKFSELYNRFKLENLNYINLKASPKFDVQQDEDIGVLLPGTLYRAALVPCLWRKCVLQSLLIQGETAWQFEILGSERSDRFDKFMSLKKPLFCLLHCIIQGKVDRRAARKLSLMNEMNKINFPVMTVFQQFLLMVRELRSLVFFLVVPTSMRRNIRELYYKYIVGDGRVV